MNKLLYKYKLEKRVSKLEKLVFENEEERPTRQARTSRCRAVKANIFSKKIEEVKTAIDQGVDVDSLNQSGKTPLALMCKSKDANNSIIKLLLDNGADPNVDCCAQPLMSYTINYKNKEGTLLLARAGANVLSYSKKSYGAVLLEMIESGLFSASEINSIVTDEVVQKIGTSEASRVGVAMYYLVHYGCKSLDNPELFVNHLVDALFRTKDPKTACRMASLTSEEKREWMLLVNAIERNGYCNTLETFITKSVVKDNDMFNKQYGLLRKAASGALKCTDMHRIIETILLLCKKDQDASQLLEAFLSQKVFNEFDSDDQWDLLRVSSSLLLAVSTESIGHKLTQSLMNLKFKAPRLSVIDGLLSGGIKTKVFELNGYEDFTRLVCRKLKLYAEMIPIHFIDCYLRYSHNTTLIENMIDGGLGDSLADHYPYVSDECKQALQSAGVDLTGDKQGNNEIINSRLVAQVIDCISNDTFTRMIRDKINENPSILDNVRIQDALHDPSNSDSITARQIQRMYDAWLYSTEGSIEKDKYDM